MASSKRITTVNLPEELVEQADRIAESRDRSRSYLVAEALRRYCDQEGKASPAEKAAG